MTTQVETQFTGELDDHVNGLRQRRRATVARIQELLGTLDDLGEAVDSPEITRLRQECCKLLENLRKLESQAFALSSNARYLMFDAATPENPLDFAGPA